MKKILFFIIPILIMIIVLMGTVAIAAETDAEVTIYLTRHGKTLFNTIGRLQGWCDSCLNDDGIEAAENLGIGLKESGITFDSAYSSDLGRQRETARIILDALDLTDIEVCEDNGLREVCFGSWEGELTSVRDEVFCEIAGVETIEELNLDLERLLEIYVETDETGMAETFDEAATRIVDTLNNIAEEAKEAGESTILVVASSTIIKTLLVYLGEPCVDVNNASVTMLYYNDGEFTVGEVGDLSYADLGAEVRGE